MGNQINKPTDYFNTVLYTGNNTGQSITGVGFQPDWLWFKMRNGLEQHNVYDSVRGVKLRLQGFTRAACTPDFHKSSQIGLCTAHYSFVKCLEDLGWEVEQRPVTAGENLGHYDKVVVFMMHISPYNTYMYGARQSHHRRQHHRQGR